MKNSATGLVLIAIVALMNCVSSAWAQPLDAMAACKAIMSAQSRMEKERAFDELQRQRGETVNCLLDNLQQQIRQPDKSWDGPFHLTVLALERLQIKQAAGPLIGLIDFQLDMKTAPGGGYYPADSAYIVAQYLVSVGTKDVADSIFQRLIYEANDDVVRASAYVLEEILGRDVVQMLIEQKQNRLATVTYNIAKADTRSVDEAKLQAKQSLERNPQAQNLTKLSQLLADEKKPPLQSKP